MAARIIARIIAPIMDRHRITIIMARLIISTMTTTTTATTILLITTTI